MKITEKEIQGLLPNLRGLPNIDPRVEVRINEAFRRVYEFFLFKLNEQEKAFKDQLSNVSITSKNSLTGLIGAYSQPLVGSSTTDPVLQSLSQEFGSQSANQVFASPSGIAGLPVFRSLVGVDIPGLDASKIISGAIALARLDTKIVKTDDNLTKVIAGAPYANDGYVVLKDNNGNSIKVMTTA